MIDLHCHFLPGIDDGAANLDEALALARAAVADGIRVSVLTPHVHLERYPNERAGIEAAVVALRAELEREGIPLQVRAGGEVRLGAEIVDLLEQDRIPFLGELGGYRVMLLEFPHSGIPIGSDRLVRYLVARRVRPLVAHPERNRELIAAPDRIKPFVDMGCMLQLTAGSLIGQFGEGSRVASEHYLAQDWVFALATDAHDLRHRVPNLGAARDLLVDRGEAGLARRLTELNPARLVGAAA